MCHEWWHNRGVPSINISQLRDTKRLKAWLRAGKTVELRERDEVIARIVPEGSSPPPWDWPDFAALRKEIFGERILPGADVVIEERRRY
jgi:antitoxin (DNA-binding transcriptional repressor) of toxin-antitoxin stability system